MKTEEKEWRYIRENEIWRIEQKENDILPVLRLSYNQMPADLKECFAYSSIFPKDRDITKRELVSLWRAQGFIQLNDRKQHLDDIGTRFFKELLSRSFFQDVFRLFDNDIWKCKMHDLVHDLAQSVAGPEYAIINLDNNTEISEKVRHISFYDADLLSKDFPRMLLKAKKLRSCLSYKVRPISKSFMNTLIGRFKCMRVLGLSGSEFEELPSSIGNLKHLRFIYLSHNRRLKALPSSICKLLNIQMLNLLGCDQLQGLPRDIRKLISLEYLYLTSQLTCLPENALEGLTSLRILHLFQCSFLTTLSEGIQYLTTLNTLRIIEFPRLSLLPSGMKHLTIKKLVIKDCQELDFSEGEGIQGLQCLRSAVIGRLPKLISLPLGLQQAATTLKNLCIDDCPRLTTFPQWTANLTALQRTFSCGLS